MICRKWSLLLLCLVMNAKLMASFSGKPFVVPELKEWKPSPGSMTLGSRTRIVYDAKQPELLRIAELMADDCFRLFQRKPEVVSGKAKNGDIVLALKPDKHLGREGYSIKISDKIFLSAFPDRRCVLGNPYLVANG